MHNDPPMHHSKSSHLERRSCAHMVLMYLFRNERHLLPSFLSARASEGAPRLSPKVWLASETKKEPVKYLPN